MKVLVLASEAVDAEAVRDALGDEIAEGADIRVISPALNDSRLAYWVDDPDEAIEHAADVQQETVIKLESDGLQATGDTGASDPLLAVEDALADFPADEIVVFAHPEGERAYLEDRLVDEVEDRFGLPVTRAEASRS